MNASRQGVAEEGVKIARAKDCPEQQRAFYHLLTILAFRAR